MDINMRGMRPPYRPAWTYKKTREKRTSPTWWIAYSLRGKVHRESSHSTKEADAWKLLKKRHGEIALNKPVGVDVQKTTFENLASMLTNDYKANSRRSLARFEDAINHLSEFFGPNKAIEITSDRITEYIAHRQQEKAAARVRSTTNFLRSVECLLLPSELEKPRPNRISQNLRWITPGRNSSSMSSSNVTWLIFRKM